jgi:hypothetical protein
LCASICFSFFLAFLGPFFLPSLRQVKPWYDTSFLKLECSCHTRERWLLRNVIVNSFFSFGNPLRP